MALLNQRVGGLTGSYAGLTKYVSERIFTRHPKHKTSIKNVRSTYTKRNGRLAHFCCGRQTVSNACFCHGLTVWTICFVDIVVSYDFCAAVQRIIFFSLFLLLVLSMSTTDIGE